MRHAIGVDIGGTKLAGGLVRRDGTVLARRRRDSPVDDNEVMRRAIVEVVTELRQEAAAEHGVAEVGRLPVGVGAAALVDLDGVLRYAPNVPAWVDEPLGAHLTEALGCTVVVDNDANAAAWGEYRVGAAKDARRSMLMLTIGTGVGGGLVLGGRLVRGWQGFAAEFGHMVIAGGGTVAGGGDRGDLEYLASGTALGRTARHARDDGLLDAGSVLSGPGELTGKRVTEAALEGDAAAVKLVTDAGEWLGIGITGLVSALDPEIVVVAGGGVAAGDLLLDPARAALAARIVGRGHRRLPPVVAAQLGGDAGTVGAALLALDGP